MILYPAIDIRGGRAVRLVQGDYDRETAFDADPLDAARRWMEGGAEALHVVDLDGARSGQPENLEHVRRIAEAASVPVQVGGGLRSADAVEDVLAAGATRVVLGTAAVEDPALVESLALDHPNRIVVGADAKSGRIAVEGWERESKTGVEALIADLAGRGVSRFVYTPVEVDGTLEGPSLDGLAHGGGGRPRGRGGACLLGGHRLARASRGPRGAQGARPGRRDRRQGALRGTVHGRRGHRRPPLASKADVLDPRSRVARSRCRSCAALARRHLRLLETDERKRLAGLVAKSKGRPRKNLSANEREEMLRLSRRPSRASSAVAPSVTSGDSRARTS